MDMEGEFPSVDYACTLLHTFSGIFSNHPVSNAINVAFICLIYLLTAGKST